jgi:hypothetical protein
MPQEQPVGCWKQRLNDLRSYGRTGIDIPGPTGLQLSSPLTQPLAAPSRAAPTSIRAQHKLAYVPVSPRKHLHSSANHVTLLLTNRETIPEPTGCSAAAVPPRAARPPLQTVAQHPAGPSSMQIKQNCATGGCILCVTETTAARWS